MTFEEIHRRLQAQRDPAAAAAMAHFAITGADVFGTSLPSLRALAREAGRDALRELTGDKVQAKLHP